MSIFVRRLLTVPLRPFPVLCRNFGEKAEKVIASKNTSGVKRDPSIINQVKRGSQKISIKNMVLLLVATNVVLAGLIYNKNRKQKKLIEESKNE